MFWKVSAFVQSNSYSCKRLRTATHCNTLQHTATHCNTLQHTATHCNTLQHTATHCIKSSPMLKVIHIVHVGSIHIVHEGDILASQCYCQLIWYIQEKADIWKYLVRVQYELILHVLYELLLTIALTCCSMLQCVAVCCSVLQCVAVCSVQCAVCSVQCVAVCSVLQCAVCCSVQCVATIWIAFDNIADFYEFQPYCQ